MNFDGKTILVTGGTGSFGTRFIDTVLERYEPHSVRVFSRDQLKQTEVATRGVDVIVHAAALKHVPVCEYNPFEAVQTNVHGAENVREPRRSTTTSTTTDSRGAEPGDITSGDRRKPEGLDDR